MKNVKGVVGTFQCTVRVRVDVLPVTHAWHTPVISCSCSVFLLYHYPLSICLSATRRETWTREMWHESFLQVHLFHPLTLQLFNSSALSTCISSLLCVIKLTVWLDHQKIPPMILHELPVSAVRLDNLALSSMLVFLTAHLPLLSSPSWLLFLYRKYS